MKYLIKYAVFENESNWFILKDLVRLAFNDIKKKGLFGSIKDQRLYNKDDHEKFDVEIELLKFVLGYDKNDVEINKMMEDDKKLKEYKKLFDEECKKEYSEEKYDMAKYIVRENNRLLKKRGNLMDKMIMDYFNETSGDLLSDIDESIDYYQTSRYINQDRYKKYASNALEILLRTKEMLTFSNISSDIENLLKR